MSDLIERFDFTEDMDAMDGVAMRPALDGEYVKFSDHEATIAAKDREIAETRQRTIEECAKVASSATYTAYMHWDPETPLRRNVEHRDAIATAIRSLGKEGSGE